MILLNKAIARNHMSKLFFRRTVKMQCDKLDNVSLSLRTSPCNCLLQRLCFANDGPIQFFVAFYDVEHCAFTIPV